MIEVSASATITECVHSTGATETPFGDPVGFQEGLHRFAGTECAVLGGFKD